MRPFSSIARSLFNAAKTPILPLASQATFISRRTAWPLKPPVSIKNYHSSASFYDSFKAQLDNKVRALDQDGFHDDGSRQKVVKRYYDAFLRLEEVIDAKDSALCDRHHQGVDYFYAESREEKAQGICIIAKRGQETVGRFFMSTKSDPDSSEDSANRLAILWVSDREIGEKLITANMIDLCDQKGAVVMDDIATSCVGFYANHLHKLAADRKFELLDTRGRPHINISFNTLRELSQSALRGDHKLIDSPAPSLEFKPLTGAAVQNSSQRDLE